MKYEQYVCLSPDVNIPLISASTILATIPVGVGVYAILRILFVSLKNPMFVSLLFGSDHSHQLF